MLSRCVSMCDLWFNKYSDKRLYIAAQFVAVETAPDSLVWLMERTDGNIYGSEAAAYVAAAVLADLHALPFIPFVEHGDAFDSEEHYKPASAVAVAPAPESSSEPRESPQHMEEA